MDTENQEVVTEVQDANRKEDVADVEHGTGAQAGEQRVEEADTETDESPEQINWRKFREARAEERKQKEEAEREAAKSRQDKEALQSYVASLLESNGQTGQVSPAQQEQIAIELARDDIPTGEEVMRFTSEYVKKEVERGVREAIAETSRAESKKTLPKQLKETMPDYWEVCTQENLDYLEYVAPALAQTLAQPFENPENLSYNQMQAVYQAVTKLVPNAKASTIRKDPERDIKRPQSMSSAAASASRDNAPHMISDALRQQRYKEMQEAARGGR